MKPTGLLDKWLQELRVEWLKRYKEPAATSPILNVMGDSGEIELGKGLRIGIDAYREAGKVRGFYDIPQWEPGDEEEPWHALFKWTLRTDLGGAAKTYSGTLKEERFCTDIRKIAYLQGVISYHKGNVGSKLYFANSYNRIARFEKWLNEVSLKKTKWYGQAIISKHIDYCIPICTTLEINRELFDFIYDYPLEACSAI